MEVLFISEEILKEIQLADELLRELIGRFNKMENKKHLYKGMEELTLIEINTILVIGLGEMKSMSSIANSLGVTFGTPTVTIDRLIVKGYVERIRDVEDRRQVFVKLSENGERVYTSIIQLKKRVAERIFGILSPEERKGLINVLSKLNHGFDELFGR